MTWFLFFCFAPVLLLVWAVTRNDAKPKNNLILSTTLPKEAWEDERVIAVIKSFRKQIDLTCLFLGLLFIPTFWIPYLSILTTYHCTLLIFICVLPNIVYCTHVRKMRALKKQYWYHPENSTVQVVDTKTSECEWKLLPTFSFLLPFLLSLVPMLYPLVVPQEGSILSFYILCVTDSICIVLFYLCYRFLLRKKSDRINADNTLSMTLTRIRVYHWGRFWLLCSWLTAFYSFTVLLLDSPIPLYIAATLIFTFLLIVVSAKSEFAVRKAQQHYNETQECVILADEDDFWWNGIVYYNKNDSSVLVNNRVGFGSSLNLAHPFSKIFTGFSLLLLLAMPFLGVWMMKEEFADVRVELGETSVKAYHLGLEYEIPLDDIISCELLTELPRCSKNVGTNFPRVYKGSFSVSGIDKNSRLCLNPKASLFLLLRTANKTYLFSMGKNDEASLQQLREIYEAIKAVCGTDYEQMARHFGEQMVNSKFSDVTALFSDTLKAQLPEAALQLAWEQTASAAGDYIDCYHTRSTKSNGMTTVVTTLEFSNIGINVSYFFGDNGKLEGIRLTYQSITKPEETESYFELPVAIGSYELDGLLTVPKHAEHPPVVILVQGSGPSDMDETVGSSKPFCDIAHSLAENGIAVLRFHKRFYQYPEAADTVTIQAEVLDDVASAIEYAIHCDKIDNNRIYLLGHSLGGMLAPEIADSNPSVKGIISLAGSPRRLEDIICDQNEALLKTNGLGETEIAEQMKPIRETANQIKALTETDSGTYFGVPAEYWYSLNQLHPSKTAQSLELPMLFLQGSEDIQVYADVDFIQWKELLGQKQNCRFRLYDGLGHFFTAEDGHVDNEVIADIVRFVLEESKN